MRKAICTGFYQAEQSERSVDRVHSELSSFLFRSPSTQEIFMFQNKSLQLECLSQSLISVCVSQAFGDTVRFLPSRCILAHRKAA